MVKTINTGKNNQDQTQTKAIAQFITEVVPIQTLGTDAN